MTEKAKIAALQPVQCKIEADKEYAYCTCGHSKEQPFCDGSHKGTSFRPLIFTSPVTTYEPICACKQTKLTPYCDGSHCRL
mgnify:CR=1 FL=1